MIMVVILLFADLYDHGGTSSLSDQYDHGSFSLSDLYDHGSTFSL